jgi:hypothetical protein
MIQRTRSHPHQYLIFARLRIRNIFISQNFRPTKLMNADCFHVFSLEPQRLKPAIRLAPGGTARSRALPETVYETSSNTNLKFQRSLALTPTLTSRKDEVGLTDRAVPNWFSAKSPGVMTRGFCFPMAFDSHC